MGEILSRMASEQTGDPLGLCQNTTKTDRVACYIYEAYKCYDGVHNEWVWATEIYLPEKQIVISKLFEKSTELRVFKPKNFDPSAVGNEVRPYNMGHPVNLRGTQKYYKIKNVHPILLPAAFVNAAIDQYESSERLKAAFTEELNDEFRKKLGKGDNTW